MKRYDVECDTPDRGLSTFAECFGPRGSRGRVLSSHATLEEAIQACGGDPATSTSAVTPWIWDRRKGCVVSRKRVDEARAKD
jgi:hypothetical protein